MDDDGDDSFGEDGDDDLMGDGSEITTQLAAAGWQHGVTFCFVLFNILYFIQMLEVEIENHDKFLQFLVLIHLFCCVNLVVDLYKNILYISG